jgi:hypothetical protein
MAFPYVFVGAIIGDGAAQDKGRATCRRYRFSSGLTRASRSSNDIEQVPFILT